MNYDVLWKEKWGQMQDLGPVHRHTIRTTRDTVRGLDVKSVIDVGCGNGSILEALSDLPQIEELWGVDVSGEAIEVAKKRVSANLLAMDFLTESIGRTFDLVVCSQVIEHIEDDDLFLHRLREITDKYAFVGTVQGRMRESERSIGHVRNYTREGLETQMEGAGFAVEKVIEWGFPFYSPLYRTASEVISGNHEKATFSGFDRVVAAFLYQLYKLNSSSHGDVIMVLAKAA